jgi:hypothetical protein
MRRRSRQLRVVVAVGLIAAASLVGGVASAESIAVATRTGYELVGSDGGVFAFAPGSFSGSLGDRRVPGKIVAALDATGNGPVNGPTIPFASGYLLVSDTGVVYPFGLHSLGDLRDLRLNAPIVAAAAVPGGYFLVAADGGVFTFGTAKFAGSLAARRLPAPIVGVAVTAAGDGYLLVDAAGDVYPFGDAHSYGDLGKTKLDAPVVGIGRDVSDSTPSIPDGYLLVTADGKVFAFGAARFVGDASNLHLKAPMAGILAGNGGYYLFAQDGGVFTYGPAFRGSMGGQHLNGPIVAMVLHVVSASCSGRPAGFC